MHMYDGQLAPLNGSRFFAANCSSTHVPVPYLARDRPGATESRIQHFHSKKLTIINIAVIAAAMRGSNARWSIGVGIGVGTRRRLVGGVGGPHAPRFWGEKRFPSDNPFSRSLSLSLSAFGFRTPKSGKRAGAYFLKMRLRAPCVRTFLLVVNLHL